MSDAEEWAQSEAEWARKFEGLETTIRALREQNEQIRSGKFTYCAYCGHTISMDADGSLIAEHIRDCPKHPIQDYKAEVERLRKIAWGVVNNPVNASRIARPRWACVMDATALGSTAATEMCHEFEADPNDSVPGIDYPEWDH